MNLCAECGGLVAKPGQILGSGARLCACWVSKPPAPPFVRFPDRAPSDPDVDAVMRMYYERDADSLRRFLTSTFNRLKKGTTL